MPASAGKGRAKGKRQAFVRYLPGRVKTEIPAARGRRRPGTAQDRAMSPTRMQLIACALLCAGGTALMVAGYFMGGGVAIAVGAVLALLTFGRRNR